MSDVCSQCDVVETGPYCPVHGDVHRAFTVDRRYDIEQLLAASASAFVFSAHDRTTRRAVALKILRSEKVDSAWCAATPVPPTPSRESQREFQRAAPTLNELPAEHSAEILNVGRDDELGITYVVIDRLELGSDAAATAWSQGVPQAEITAGSSQTRPSNVLDALERLALPDMIGSYRVVRLLGAGGTGRVYLGEHPVIGSKVAIKVLLPEIARQNETVQRFLQEARASSQIGSPHIPRYFDFGTTLAGLPYAVMEYFEGETLGKRLARGGTMSVADTAQIIDQVAGALQMAHDAGLIHRDLKPENLLLVEPTQQPGRLKSSRTASMTAQPGAHAIEVKLLDFGIAKVIGRRSAAQTQSGAFLGTPFYCAPEQVFGHDVDARTDVYSLGATAFEMLTGAPPFVGEVPEILSSKATEEAPDPRAFGVPDVVAETIRLMLAREPKQRAPSMAWVRAQVARWTRPGGAESVPPDGEPLEHGETAQMPAVRFPDDLARLARADTAAVTDDDGLRDDDDDVRSTSAAIRAAREPGRGRRALWLTGGGLAVAASVVLLLVRAPLHADPPGGKLAPAASASAATSPTPAAEIPAPPPIARDAVAHPVEITAQPVATTPGAQPGAGSNDRVDAPPATTPPPLPPTLPGDGPRVRPRAPQPPQPPQHMGKHATPGEAGLTRERSGKDGRDGKDPRDGKDGKRVKSGKGVIIADPFDEN